MIRSFWRGGAWSRRLCRPAQYSMCRGPLLQSAWTRRFLATLSRVARSSSRRTTVGDSGLWGMHPSHSPVRVSMARSAVSSTTAHGEKSTLASQSPPPSETMNTLGNWPSPTSFALDPPFAQVKGEAELAPGPCVYTCRFCRALVFRSDKFAETSRVGRHDSGWPTFLAPSTPSALRVRTVLQKSVVARLSDTPRYRSASDMPDARTRSGRGLCIAVPHNGVAQRGLAVERDLVRRRGSRISLQETQSWREMCLRDENHRADPALIIGACSACGTPLCHITQSTARGMRYISTAACIEAQAEPVK
ncbi:hypothetical protein CUR178_08150 [Leishmania enriettii]|uniref:Uncharacterized protein n=1 Tax=Leishmania enriettii TaxID=5663 RepID=A0A836I368_LEIEN|nr:hypothetical protein CUR178_08150 [Leishmania enriettii]